jgi:radical SAM superfamily enzyme YgiQ (UPF0313 family)
VDGLPTSLYLIHPRSPVPTYFGGESHAAFGFDRAVLLADVALPTVAALAPADFQITLCEEEVQNVDFGTAAELVGITGKIGQEGRMIELAREFRRRGKIVIFGGPYASLSPDRLRGHCDILVRGELENLAGEFFADLRAGTWKAEYVGDKPDLRNSPIPRWDLYPNDRAFSATLQTSRGCPFECEFCDVIQYLGRKQRHKPPEQVLAELDVLYGHGHRAVFLADDNFTVYPARTKELLRAIIEWNDSRAEGRVAFTTQVSIDCTRDAEMLQLCSDAGMVSVFIGLETPNAASLKETKKRQNLAIDVRERLGRLAAHGMMAIGGMMVGFDADTPDIFEQQYEFAMSLPVPMFSAGPVSAPMATPLYARMAAANRLVELGAEAPAASPLATNIVPQQMSVETLTEGMRWLCNRLYRPSAFEHRLGLFIDQLQPAAPRRNSFIQGGTARQVGLDRISLSRSVGRLGRAEAVMAARLEQRLLRKPAALPWVLLALGHYMQVRHVYESCGVWAPVVEKSRNQRVVTGAMV